MSRFRLCYISTGQVGRLVNKLNGHERNMFVFVLLVLTEQTIEDELLKEQGILVRVCLCSLVNSIDGRFTNVNEQA